MDTSKAAYEVPTFKVARVGNDRKRRGGALAWARGGGSRGVWNGVGGSSAGGSVNVLGMTMSKTLLAVLVTSAIGSASIYTGKITASDGSAVAPAEKPKLFAQDRNTSKYEGDVSNLPSNPNSIPNSMGYVMGSIDGLTPEERAKKAAEAAEAQRKADEEAKLAEANANKDNGGQADPAALLASAKADGGKQGGALARKFGQLNTGTGGGSALVGGAGLSGGVGRSFATTALNKPNAGTLSASRSGSKAAYSGARAATASSKVKGFARQQLMNANTLSRAGAAAGRNETASYDAAAAFDNNAGAGTAITGAGIGNGSNPGGATPTPTPDTGGGGGPLAQTPMCTGTQYPDPTTGACVGTTIPKSKNATPYQSLLNIAMGLMMALSVLAALSLAANFFSPFFGIGEYIKKIISTAMLVIGIALMGIGAAIVSMGDMVAGGIVAVTGALTVALSFLTPETVGSGTFFGQAAGALISNVAGMIGASATRKRAAAAAMD